MTTKGKPISIWANWEEEVEIKKRAKKAKRSVSNFIKLKIFEDVD